MIVYDSHRDSAYLNGFDAPPKYDIGTEIVPKLRGLQYHDIARAENSKMLSEAKENEVTAVAVRLLCTMRPKNERDTLFYGGDKGKMHRGILLDATIASVLKVTPAFEKTRLYDKYKGKHVLLIYPSPVFDASETDMITQQIHPEGQSGEFVDFIIGLESMGEGYFVLDIDDKESYYAGHTDKEMAAMCDASCPVVEGMRDAQESHIAKMVGDTTGVFIVGVWEMNETNEEDN